ncbi:unnamed protein product [Amaranthus hypochondriacus]
MDLLRAVIVGTAGTPYHDGLYVFDALFEASYPLYPPSVHFHAHGLGLNPNLYSNGHICLSLLNSWIGSFDERWIPYKSTMLQVLVSLQALVLNAMPLFNEEFHPACRGKNRMDNARKYNETVFTESLKLMQCTIINPPEHFEDLVVGHFRAREFDIMMACLAYSEGAEVGCNVKEWFEEGVNAPKSGSEMFRGMLRNLMKSTIQCLADNGSSDNGVQEVSQPSTSDSGVQEVPQPTTSDGGVQELPQPTTSDNEMQEVSQPPSPNSEMQEVSQLNSPDNEVEGGIYTLDF